jgi:ABC-2 type transport system ATP-binding protein
VNPIIEVNELHKAFVKRKKTSWFRRSVKGDGEVTVKTAVHPLSFTAEPGETIAFIGPNGAGKSTTIKMLTGILHPTSGDARVLGLRPWEDREALSYQISTVFGQKSQLWYHLPPDDTFTLMGKIYDIPKSEFQSRKNELIERFNLGPLMNTPVRKLSLGERMRCEIAISFLHRPRILFLDEPTIGLDVLVKQSIRELIRDLNQKEEVTVFLTSHDATDVEALCQRVLVINHGSLLFDGPTEQLIKRFLHYKEVRLQVKSGTFHIDHPGVEVTHQIGGEIHLKVDVRQIRIDEVLSSLLNQCEVGDISIVDPPMEDIIRAIYLERPTSLNSSNVGRDTEGHEGSAEDSKHVENDPEREQVGLNT